jgi:hypothetical protein
MAESLLVPRAAQRLPGSKVANFAVRLGRFSVSGAAAQAAGGGADAR